MLHRMSANKTKMYLMNMQSLSLNCLINPQFRPKNKAEFLCNLFVFTTNAKSYIFAAWLLQQNTLNDTFTQCVFSLYDGICA